MDTVNGHEGWVCRPCRLLERKAQNARAASAKGRAYRIGAPKGFRHVRSPSDVSEFKWRSLEEANARQAWQWWIEHAPDTWSKIRQEFLRRPTFRERYRSDPSFRQREIERVARRKAKRGRFDEYVREVLKGKASERRMQRCLGYGRSELLEHLVVKFAEGMTLESLMRGDIHIDHDVPVRRFDPKDPAQLRQLWALTNIYPLWAIDNARKGARTRAQWMARDGSDRRHAA